MKMKIRISLTLLLAGAFFLFAVVSAQALKYTFDNITNNNPSDAAIGETQFWVEVTDPGANQVLFTFGNTGSEASSICDVYFDDGGSLLGIAGFIDADDGVGGDPGVDFSQYAYPSNLPGANKNNISPPFETTVSLSAGSDPSVQLNGINPGETLGILFDLIQPGQTLDDVIDDLASGDLCIGIHVQGFASKGSENFVSVVPEPATIVLFGAGLIGLAGLGRKKFFKLN